MQDKKMTKEYMLLAIPVELLEESGLCGGELIQITAERKKIVIEGIEDTGDMVCDGDCGGCPVYATQGENCPNKNYGYAGGNV